MDLNIPLEVYITIIIFVLPIATVAIISFRKSSNNKSVATGWPDHNNNTPNSQSTKDLLNLRNKQGTIEKKQSSQEQNPIYYQKAKTINSVIQILFYCGWVLLIVYFPGVVVVIIVIAILMNKKKMIKEETGFVGDDEVDNMLKSFLKPKKKKNRF